MPPRTNLTTLTEFFSNAAALTGKDALYDVAMSYYGVIRVSDYDELLEVSNLLANSPAPVTMGLAMVSHSGGITSLTADMCGQAGWELPELSDAARNGIRDQWGAQRIRKGGQSFRCHWFRQQRVFPGNDAVHGQ